MSTLKVNAIESQAADSAPTIAGLQFPTAGPLSNRNYIINGDMAIFQRANQTVANPTDGRHFVDRFVVFDSANNTGATEVNWVTDVPAGEGFSRSLEYEITTGASIPINGYVGCGQYIEGINTRRLELGTANAKKISLSFWCKLPQGTYAVVLRNDAADNALIKEWTVSAANNNVWHRQKIENIQLSTSGTWLEGEGDLGMGVLWMFDVGTDFHGTADTVNTSNLFGTANMTNTFADTTGNKAYITGVQLEEGEVCTPFEFESFSVNFHKCQRYYEIGGQYHTSDTASGAIGRTSIHYSTRKALASPVVDITVTADETGIMDHTTRSGFTYNARGSLVGDSTTFTFRTRSEIGNNTV